MRRRGVLTRRAETLLVATVVILAGIQGAQLLQRVSPQAEQAKSCSGLACLLPQAYGLTSPSNYLAFQGQLTATNGAPITTTTTFALSLYDAASAGNLIYNETQSVTPDSRGLFYVQIGAGTAGTGSPTYSAWSSVPFNEPYYLAVRIGSSGSYLTPRIALSAAPYQDGQVAWGQLITFPTACSSGSAITSLGTTPVCTGFMQSISSTSTSTSCAGFLNTASVSASTSTLNAGFGCGGLASTSTSTSCAGFLNTASASATLSTLAQGYGCGALVSTSTSTSCAGFLNTASASATVSTVADGFGCGGIASTSTSTSCGAGSFINTASESATLSTVAGGFGCAAQTAYNLVSTSTLTSCAAGSAINSVSVSATATTINYADGCTAEITVGSTTISCASQSYVTTVSASASVVNAGCAQPYQLTVVTAAQSMDTTTFTTATSYSCSLAASSQYTVEIYVPFNVATTVDGVAFSVSGFTNMVPSLQVMQYLAAGSTAPYGYQVTTTSAVPASTTSGPTTAQGAWITGTVTTGTTAGTFQLLFEEVPKTGTTSSITLDASGYIKCSLVGA